MSDIVRQWRCQLDIPSVTPPETVSVDAQLVVYVTGRADLTFSYRGDLQIADGATAVGTTSGFDVVLENLGIERVNRTINVHTGFTTTVVATFMAGQLTRTTPPAGMPFKEVVHLKAARVRGTVQVGSDLTITSRSLNGDRRGYLLSATAELSANVTLPDLILLLTLAQRCPIFAPLRERHDATGIVSVEIAPNESTFTATMPLIPYCGTDLAIFLKTGLPKVSSLNRDYELARLCNYYALSVQRQYAEEMFMLASVVMEAFKFHWAKNVGKLTPDLKANGLVRGFVKGTAQNGRKIHFTFEELLKQATTALGLNQTHTFIEDRNALFHTGAPGAAQTLPGSGIWLAIEPELVTLYRQIDDILLTLIGYTGPIHRWDDINNSVLFPPR
ncbi:MAG: hypothetical protein KIT72_05515 [Polyangiaceae bacterium]|nr:hypothetical protein [Polyangiaceae bacterium]MCW5789857.1 hypothetical protein [Polyangiaceae bacterium]